MVLRVISTLSVTRSVFLNGKRSKQSRDFKVIKRLTRTQYPTVQAHFLIKKVCLKTKKVFSGKI